jgi:hypothetical protein
MPKAVVDLAGLRHELAQVLDAGEHTEVVGLVDDSLDAQRPRYAARGPP